MGSAGGGLAAWTWGETARGTWDGQSERARAEILGRGLVRSVGEGREWREQKTRQIIHRVSQWERTECDSSLIMTHSPIVYST